MGARASADRFATPVRRDESRGEVASDDNGANARRTGGRMARIRFEAGWLRVAEFAAFVVRYVRQAGVIRRPGRDSS